MFVKYSVYGLNGFSIIQKLHEEGICVYTVEHSDKKITFSIDFTDSKKFFAISRNMCYNIYKVGYYGYNTLFKKIFENVGFFLCFVCLFVTMKVFDPFVSKIIYLGDGEYLRPKIEKIIFSEGIKPYTLLKSDMDALSNKVLFSNEEFSFVSIRKSGRILYIEAYAKKQEYYPIDVKKDRIISTVTGTVSYINLLSGTAVVNVGDRVKMGDLLIDGSYEKDGEKIKTYALGEIEIVAEYTYYYKTFAKGEQYKNRAKAVAIDSLGEVEVVNTEVKENVVGGENCYEVTVYYYSIIS